MISICSDRRGPLRLPVGGLTDQFARAGADVSRQATTDLSEVLNDVVEELRPAAEQNRIDLNLEVPRTALLACSPGVLSSIVSNLVRNAITHMGSREVRQVGSE